MSIDESAVGVVGHPAAETTDETTNFDADGTEVVEESQGKASLRTIIEAAAEENELGLGTLTVMSNQTDPYRIDSPAKHRDAEWFARAWKESGAKHGIHLRGVHYAVVSAFPPILKPDGEPYLNTHENWIWLQQVSGYARWLGYIPFEAVIDERNQAPIIETEAADEAARLRVAGGERAFDLPDFDAFLPDIELNGCSVRQAYRLVMIGEKQSLATVLRPIAHTYHAELVLPTGELSTTLLYGIVKRAYEDGRPCRIFYFSDFDPAGFHMPIEVSRKIQALVDLHFPGLDIEVRRCALTADQVRELGLPSTPLKDTEKRADRWRERFGVEQTEIDALATLRPDVLKKIAIQALNPYFDHTLQRRLNDVRSKALDEARELLQEAIDDHDLDDISVRYELAVGEAKAAIREAEEILEEIYAQADEAIEAIEIELPEPNPRGDVTDPLFTSSDYFVEATLKLKEAKL